MSLTIPDPLSSVQDSLGSREVCPQGLYTYSTFTKATILLPRPSHHPVFDRLQYARMEGKALEHLHVCINLCLALSVPNIHCLSLIVYRQLALMLYIPELCQALVVYRRHTVYTYAICPLYSTGNNTYTQHSFVQCQHLS